MSDIHRLEDKRFEHDQLNSVLSKDYIVDIARGGTSQPTPPKARLAIGAIGIDDRNQPLKALGLGSGGQAQVTVFEGGLNLAGRNSVSGPTTLALNQTQAYTITDYDSLINYVLEPIVSGTVSRNGNTITYTAPNTAGNFGFRINGRECRIIVTQPKPAAPSILSPAPGSLTVGNRPTASSSAFAVLNGSDTHQSSDWQLASDSGFINILQQVADDVVNKTTWTIGVLQPGTQYWLRCRHRGATTGYGDWGNPVTFTTKTQFDPTNEVAATYLTANSSGNETGYGTDMVVNSNASVVYAAASIFPHQSNMRGLLDVKRRVVNSWSLFQTLIGPSGIPSNSNAYSAAICMSANQNRFALITTSNYHPNDHPDPGGVGFIPGFVDIHVIQADGFLQAPATRRITQSELPGVLQFSGDVALAPDGNDLYFGVQISSNGQKRVQRAQSDGSNWSITTSLQHTSGANRQFFGSVIKMSHNGLYMFIAADNDVSVYNRPNLAANFSFQATIPYGSLAINKEALACSDDGDLLFLGNRAALISGLNQAGNVVVYKRTGSAWALEATLTAAAPMTNGQFGKAVAISPSGQNLFVLETGRNKGTIHNFKRDNGNWSFSSSFTSPTITASLYSLGGILCLSRDGNYLIASSPSIRPNQNMTGGIIVFGT